jgi:hypothetical protein
VDRIKAMLIVSGFGNLSQTIMWLVIIVIIRKTSLDLLKVLAVMMSAMNLLWFIACLSLY